MRASGVPKRHGLRQRIRCGGATRSRFNQSGGGRRFQPHFASNQQSAVQRRQILPERRRGLRQGQESRHDGAPFGMRSGTGRARHTSNRKKKGEGNVKNGNKYLAWAL